MKHYDPTDPAAEVKYLKAMEQGKAWPATYPDPAKVKKGKGWPAAADAAKAKTPRTPRPAAVDPFAAGQLGGMSLSEVVRAVLLIAAAAAAALLID